MLLNVIYSGVGLNGEVVEDCITVGFVTCELKGAGEY